MIARLPSRPRQRKTNPATNRNSVSLKPIGLADVSNVEVIGGGPAAKGCGTVIKGLGQGFAAGDTFRQWISFLWTKKYPARTNLTGYGVWNGSVRCNGS